MKLLELDIENFGIFSAFQLQLDPGFQVVFGENEAGKSTLLQLIRELLFGFPHQSQFAFDRHQGEMAASALVELSEGTRVRFRRRKGKKNTVMGQNEATGDPVDDAELSRLLSGPRLDLYQHVFGFSLSELSDGEKSLAHANLTEALYGGGLGGLAAMQRAHAALKEEREGLYLPSKKANRRINQLLRCTRQHAKQLSETVFKPRDFQQLCKVFAENELQVDQLRESLEQLRRRQAHCRRLSEALTPWRQRLEAEQELARLEVPNDFPPDAADQYARCRESLDHIDTELSDTGNELDEVAERLRGIVLSPELIEQEAEIKLLQQQIGKMQGFRNDLPRRLQDAASIRNAVLAKLSQLNPEWGLEQIELFRSSLAQREAFESLRVRWDQLQRRASELEAQRSSLLIDISVAKKRMAELDTVETVPLLADVIDRQPQYEADQKSWLETDRRLQSVAAEIHTLRTKLDAPMNRSISNAEQLPVPMEATVIEFRQRFEEMDKVVAHHQQQLEGVRSEVADKQRALEELEAEQPIPSRQELLAQRARRDEGWQLIRQKYVLGKPDAEKIHRWLSGDEELLADVYEREAAHADHLADQLQANAETVARREQLVAEIDRMQQQVDLAQRQWQKRRGEAQEVMDQWHGLWSSCRFEPLSPDAMRDWLRLHGELLDRLEEKTSIEVQRRDVEARIGDFEDELREALPKSTDSPQRQLAVARQKTEDARQVAAERQAYQTQLPRKTEQLQRLDHERDEVKKQLHSWQEQRRSILEETGFPVEWDIHVATKILNGIGEARQEYSQALSHEEQAENMEKELAQFETRVDRLCAEMAEDLTGLPAEDRVMQLGHRLETARQGQQDQERLQENKSKLEKRRGAKQAQRQHQQQRLDQLMQAAGASSEGEFHTVADTAARQRRLASTLESLTQQIRTIRGTEKQQPFEAALAEADDDSIAAESWRLSEQITSGEAEYRAAVESLGIHRDRLQKLDETSDALRLQMELESTRSELAASVDRWAPLVLAEAIMKQAIARFEREHQPEMLHDVKRLFSRMTQDRYTDVRRKLDGSLLVDEHGGSAKGPHQLSRGTREQLYLAIRLAYVRHYSRSAEPLPLVMDDVLVNFDDERALGALEVLWEIAESLQIIFLTCHQSMIDLIRSARPSVEPIHLQTGALLNS